MSNTSSSAPISLTFTFNIYLGSPATGPRPQQSRSRYRSRSRSRSPRPRRYDQTNERRRSGRVGRSENRDRYEDASIYDESVPVPRERRRSGRVSRSENRDRYEDTPIYDESVPVTKEPKQEYVSDQYEGSSAAKETRSKHSPRYESDYAVDHREKNRESRRHQPSPPKQVITDRHSSDHEKSALLRQLHRLKVLSETLKQHTEISQAKRSSHNQEAGSPPPDHRDLRESSLPVSELPESGTEDQGSVKHREGCPLHPDHTPVEHHVHTARRRRPYFYKKVPYISDESDDD
ncbi:hypothetical protein EDC01DRAFT_746191 [Geopyxis carbonaria]|nr:hypothetical protein EDC01DRAFT_746191 [Geopyxis carbonaria]